MTIDFLNRTALPRTCRGIYRFECGGHRVGFTRKLQLLPTLLLKSAAELFSYAMGVFMNRVSLTALKFFALLFLLPGLAGLVFSAMVSTDYLESLPKSPAPSEQRMTPRNVHGIVIFQTVQEDERLSAMEYTSVSVFLVGLLLGIVYLEKWSSSRQFEMESDLLEEAEA
jgi:hypothetical protein